MTQCSISFIDLARNPSVEEIPSYKTLARTDEELKKCPIFNNQFLHEVLKEAESDAEEQFISHAFQESLCDHDDFCMKLFKLDWFLEKYEGLFNRTKNIIINGSIPLVKPTTQQNPYTNTVISENKGHSSIKNTPMTLQDQPPFRDNNLLYAAQTDSIISSFPIIPIDVGSQASSYVDYSSYTEPHPLSLTLRPLDTRLDTQYTEIPVYPSIINNSEKVRRESNKDSLVSNGSKPYKKRKVEKKQNAKEMLLRVKDYLENVLGEVNKMCETDEYSLNNKDITQDVIKLITDRIAIFK